jgi:glycosyltransferase involved in cell wall biosynthesis
VRFGLVIYGSLDFPSGGFLYDRKLVEHLRKGGHSVEIISLPWRNNFLSLIDYFSPSLLNRLLSLDVDILLQDELNHPSLFLLNRKVKSKRNWPIVSIVHHLRSSEGHSKLLGGLYAQIEKRYLKTVDAFVINSQTTLESVVDLLGSTKRNVVANPAGDRLEAKLSASEIEKRTKSDGPLRVVFVGNLIRRKAPHLIIEALSQIPKDSAHVWLAGSDAVDATYVKQLRRMTDSLGLQAQVHFLGFQDKNKLAQLLRESNVMVVPSRYEGYGIVYLEGMAFGLPAIGTRAGAAGEIIRHEKNGYIIEPGNAGQLATALDDLHRDRQRLLEMSHAALERYRQQPSWQQSMALAANFLETYIIESKS